MRWSASSARSMPSAMKRPWRPISSNGATAIAARPRWCSSPATTEEVAAILKRANETKTAIVPQGGNTGLVGGQIPFETGHEVVVSLERLTRVRDIDLASNTMTVEAGLVLALAQQVAASAGRLFPLSLASEGSAQIGGVLATNAGGMAVLAYGSARDLTLGLEVVLADGRVWNGLKSLRKDNSGYDLKDLIIGSEGTLGIITAAVLRLFPKVAEKVTCMAGLSALETAPAFFARAFERAGPALTAFEIMPRIGVEFVLRHGSSVRDPFPSPLSLVRAVRSHQSARGRRACTARRDPARRGSRGRRDRRRGDRLLARARRRAVAPARADERGAEARRRQHQARRRGAGGARAGTRGSRQSAGRADDPGRAARPVRPSRRRQHPLQCEPAARHGPRRSSSVIGRRSTPRCTRSCSTSAARSAPSTASGA